MANPASLAEYRTQHELTLEEAGSKFGVDKSTFLRWELGRVPPARAVEIEGVTGVPLHALRPDVFPKPAVDRVPA